MREKGIQLAGIILTLLYGAGVVWLYATQPRSFKEAMTQTRVSAGVYEINQEKFARGLELFRQDNFRAARDEFAQADPAQQDARTQFYLAYSYYREGWGRVYNDDALFKQGIPYVERAAALDANLKVADDNLKMHTPAELKAELQKGTETTLDDMNPLRVLRERK